MRMSDWSSDVCSSDLDDLLFVGAFQGKADLAGLQAGGDARTGEDDIIAGGKEGRLKLKRKMLIARREAAKQAALVGLLTERPRSEERRVGEEGVGRCRDQVSQYHKKKKNIETN